MLTVQSSQYSSQEQLNADIAAYSAAVAEHFTTIGVPAPLWPNDIVWDIVRNHAGQYQWVEADPSAGAQLSPEPEIDPLTMVDPRFYAALGIPFDGQRVPAEYQSLAELLLAAIDQPLTSDEASAVCAAVGGGLDSRWLAFVDVVTQRIREQREARYRVETDPMFLKAWELDEPERTAALAEWKAAKDAIRAELPYPE